MSRPFVPRDILNCPVSIAIAGLAIGVSLLLGTSAGAGLAPAFPSGPSPNPGIEHPWTLLTDILPHGSMAHLVFNIMAWWYIAPRIEMIWGWAKLLGLTVLLALISSGAQVALSGEGIGLSGVLYGLFTLAYIIQRTDQRFAGMVNSRTAGVLIAWFFVCIFLSLSGAMPIGNVAHGAGALGGALIAMAVRSQGSKRALYIAAVSLITILSLLGATILRPYVNLDKYFNRSIESSNTDQ